MGIVKVPTQFNIELEFEIPEFYQRFLSWITDVIIQYFYLRLAIEIFKLFDDFDDPLGGFFLLLLLPVMLYHVLLEITMNGQSFGKKITGIRVVDEMGGKPSLSQFLIRWLLRISDMWIVILFLYLVSDKASENYEALFAMLSALIFLFTDVILVLTTRKSQRIGDILAKTILIKVNTKQKIEETVFQEVEENYTPRFPQIMQLSDKDMNAIKSILETASKKRDYELAERAAQKIKTHLKIETDMNNLEFLETLLKDYNYLSVN
ncbi:MAG: RDD family protein [Chitinophagaceae bacterium]|nr:RDD family protein [Chitinophagaceae bacterium]